MSEEYLEPITPEVVEEPKNNTTKTILIVAIVIVVLCICLCLCVIGGLTIMGPTVGNVFSEIEYELMLTPMP